jgi:protein TonB
MAKEMGAQEKIYVQFIISKSGEVKDARVVKGSNADLKKESLRLINSIPKMVPAKQRGKPVKTNFTMPIIFKLK